MTTGRLLSCFAIAVVFVCSAYGQGRPVTSIDRRIDTLNRQSQASDRDRSARELREQSRRKVDPSQTRRIRKEIEEDLNALQTIYNEIALSLKGDTAVSKPPVIETAQTVRKHAVRLRTNLLLPQVELPDRANELPQANTARRSLSELCTRIYGLLISPLFENTSGFDAKEAESASLALEELLRFSEKLLET